LHTREFNHSAVKMGNVSVTCSIAEIYRHALTLVGHQGAKAQQKRERNQKDSKAAKSQLKVVRGTVPD
jgi:hypothetical protein